MARQVQIGLAQLFAVVTACSLALLTVFLYVYGVLPGLLVAPSLAMLASTLFVLMSNEAAGNGHQRRSLPWILGGITFSLASICIALTEAKAFQYAASPDYGWAVGYFGYLFTVGGVLACGACYVGYKLVVLSQGNRIIRSCSVIVTAALVAASGYALQTKRNQASSDRQRTNTWLRLGANVEPVSADTIAITMLPGANATQQLLDRIHENRSNIAILVLTGAEVSDASLKAIGEMPRLKMLSLDDTRITDESLSTIARIAPNLTMLSLSRTAIQGENLGALSRVEELNSLSLDGLDIPDEQLRDRQLVEKLEFLSLRNVKVSPETLRFIRDANSKLRIER